MTTEEWIVVAVQIAVGALTLLGTIAAAAFAWRGWERGRRLVEILNIETEEGRVRVGREKVGDLFLLAEFRARRNPAYIADAFVEAGGQRVKGSPPEFTAKHTNVREGTAVVYRWRSAKLAALPKRKRWRVCWMDSEDKLHCEGGDVPADMVKALLERAERDAKLA